jgi:hypothetical protein
MEDGRFHTFELATGESENHHPTSHQVGSISTPILTRRWTSNLQARPRQHSVMRSWCVTLQGSGIAGISSMFRISHQRAALHSITVNVYNTHLGVRFRSFDPDPRCLIFREAAVVVWEKGRISIATASSSIWCRGLLGTMRRSPFSRVPGMSRRDPLANTEIGDSLFSRSPCRKRLISAFT